MMTFVDEGAAYGQFGFACLAAALLITLAVFLILRRRRYLLVRPSMQVACLYTIFFIWPLAIFAANIGHWMPDPYAFLMVFVIFVAALLFFNLLTLQKTSIEVWQRVTQPDNLDPRRVVFSVFLLGMLAAAIMVVYFRKVPISETGLVVALVDPSRSAEARDESLKLLDDQFTKYAFSIFASGLGPLLGVMLVWCVSHAARKGRLLAMLLSVVLFVIVLVALSITGARSLAVSTLLAVMLAALFRRGFRTRIFPLVLAAMLIILPAVVITVFRENRGFELDLLMEQISAVVVERVFVSPLETAAAYVHMAQSHGYFGIDAVPKLAQSWAGRPGIDVPNLIGLKYFEVGNLDINANAGFVATYFSYFGSFGLMLSILCAMSLDLVLLSYRKIADHLLVPCVAVLAAAMFALLSVDFTVILVTYGFVVVPAIAVAVSFFTRGARAAGKTSP